MDQSAEDGLKDPITAPDEVNNAGDITLISSDNVAFTIQSYHLLSSRHVFLRIMCFFKGHPICSVFNLVLYSETCSKHFMQSVRPSRPGR